MNIQHKAPDTMPLDERAFASSESATLYWLAGAGFLLNIHGKILLVDPVLTTTSARVCETGLPLLVDYPIAAADIPHVDAVLYTHTDNDHLGPVTASTLFKKDPLFLGTSLVKKTLVSMGANGARCVTGMPGDVFDLKGISVEWTPADHLWQLSSPDEFGTDYNPEDCSGYKIKTDGVVIWFTGDTRLMPEHLDITDVDVLPLDVSRDAYRMGIQGAIILASHLKTAKLIPYHYGTYDAPEHSAHNGNPDEILPYVRNAESRVKILAPGEPFVIE